MPSSSGHPDPGLLAAHAERRLAGAEAAQLEAHLADCSTCCETFAETVKFLLAEEPAEEPVPNPARVLAFHRRPAFQIAAGLAAAAGLVLAVRYFSLARSPRPSSPLAELAQAMGPTRFIEPRLTGGFQHGRLVVLRSGNAPQGLDAQSPAVLTAVAQHPTANPERHVPGRARGPGRHLPRLGRSRRRREGARVGDGTRPQEREAAERPRRRLPRARDPPRRAVGHPESARGCGKVDRAEGRASRSLVQPCARARAAAPRGRRTKSVGRLPEARLDLGLGRGGEETPR